MRGMRWAVWVLASALSANALHDLWHSTLRPIPQDAPPELCFGYGYPDFEDLLFATSIAVLFGFIGTRWWSRKVSERSDEPSAALPYRCAQQHTPSVFVHIPVGPVVALLASVFMLLLGSLLCLSFHHPNFACSANFSFCGVPYLLGGLGISFATRVRVVPPLGVFDRRAG